MYNPVNLDFRPPQLKIGVVKYYLDRKNKKIK